jgi:2-polyprenyl-3-methyl-5-hydroxy-6-metoxy-1,4-benzoquinol methylase
MNEGVHIFRTPPDPALRRCRLCAGKELKPLFTVQGCRVARCPNCDLTQVVDRISAARTLSLYSPAYFSHEKYRDQETLRRENERRLRLVQRFLKGPFSRIFEVGCGTGDFITCAKRTCEISGFDLSLDAVDIARRNNPEIATRIYCSDVNEIELPGSHFHGVCLWDAIEHFWDLEPICKKLMDSLMPGGFLFLSTPDIRSLMGRALGRFWPLMTPPEHVSFLSRASLSHLFEDRLKSTVVYSSAKGKWVNLRFALRKIQKVTPAKRVARILESCQHLLPANFSVYFPSHDIRYVVVRKSAEGGG